jgi:hypothetical protein
MATISNSSSGNAAIAALLANAGTSSPPAAGAAAPDDSAGADRGPATQVQLSDQVKAILAKANDDATAAERLKAFVQSRRAGGTTDTSPANASKSDAQTTDVNRAFAQLTGGSNAQPGADDLAPVKAAHDFSNGVTFNGYTLGVMASAESGSSRIELQGPNGLSFYDFRFGWSDEASGISGVEPGMTVSSIQKGNVEYISISQSQATVSSTTVSTGSQNASSSAALAYSSQVTFAIDFSTGSIRATESDVLTAASARSTTSPLPFSTLA